MNRRAKPAVTYTFGLITGIAVTIGFFWSQRPAPVVTTPAPQAAANGTAPAPQPPPAVSSDRTFVNSAPSSPSLESALKEIQEAGMVVIPQEFARFLMPSLLSTRPEPAVRQILQLDDREASALAKARMSFDSAIQKTIDANLQVTDVKDGVVTATLPAFKEERQKLINAWRADSLAGLDAESAAIAAHIDFDRAIEGFYSQGNMDLTVTFKPAEDPQKVVIEYRGQTANGDQRQNWNFRSGMTHSQLLKRFPSLQPHFPQLGKETKP